MKYIQISLIVLLMSFSSLSSFGQSKFYAKDGTAISIIGEETRILFDDQTKQFEIAGAAIAALLPSVVDLGFKIAADQIDRKLEKYTSEFSASNTYLGPAAKIPDFTIRRQFIRKGSSEKEDALSFTFKPLFPNGATNSFVYVLTDVQVDYSGAKVKKGYPYNDYAIELKVTFFTDGKKETQELSVKSIQLIEVQKADDIEVVVDKNFLYVSDKIPIGEGFQIAEISVKIVETNTAKVRAEQFKKIYDTYKDDAKTIINNIIEQTQGEEEGGGEDGGEAAGEEDGSPE